MFEKILLPLDGSEISELALPYAVEIAQNFGSEITLLHVNEHGLFHHERMDRLYFDRLMQPAFGDSGDSQKVNVVIEEGEPAEKICKFIDFNNVSLVIMTNVATTGLRIGKMVGSVADHVCRNVHVPVLLIRPQFARRIGGNNQLINHVLVPIDGSDPSTAAITVAAELCVRLHVPLTLFQMARIIHPYAESMEGSLLIDYEKVTQDESKFITQEMIILEKALKRQNVDVNYSVVAGSDAADEIIKIGEKVDIDLVVMSTHGRSGMKRWVLGSVAEKVLRHGDKHLLLVHKKLV